MTEKELKRLRRAELLEMLLEQTKETEELKKELSEAEKKGNQTGKGWLYCGSCFAGKRSV